MAPAHHVITLQLVGCPDPDPTYTRFFAPARDVLPADLDEIGRRYIGALADEVAKFLRHLDRVSAGAPVGVCFSGGVDSGAVFVVTEHVMRQLGIAPTRLKAFTLNLGDGAGPASRRGSFLRTWAWSSISRRLPAIRPRSISTRPCGSSRTTSRSTSSARRWACCCTAAFASATRSGATCSTATAATRT